MPTPASPQDDAQDRALPAPHVLEHRVEHGAFAGPPPKPRQVLGGHPGGSVSHDRRPPCTRARARDSHGRDGWPAPPASTDTNLSEVAMSSTDVRSGSAAAADVVGAPGMDMKLEVVVIPVSDVDRAKEFYAEARVAAGCRLRRRRRLPARPVHAAGSPCSIMFGTGVTRPRPARPGPEPDRLRHRGCARGARRPRRRGQRGLPRRRRRAHRTTGRRDASTGPDPERPAYASFASFSDPDGNGWVLQEITTRLPGRGSTRTRPRSPRQRISASALRRAAAAHGEHEKRTGKRDATGPTGTPSTWSRSRRGTELPT